MDLVGDLLGDQGGVAAGAVVDDEVDLDLVRNGLIYDFCRVFDNLRIQHARDHFVKREGFGIGFLVAHPQGSYEADNHLLPCGENPLWIAKVMGHRNTDMIIKVYSRYVENATGSKDGAAFDGLYQGIKSKNGEQ